MIMIYTIRTHQIVKFSKKNKGIYKLNNQIFQKAIPHILKDQKCTITLSKTKILVFNKVQAK